MNCIYVIKPNKNISSLLQEMLSAALGNFSSSILVENIDAAVDLRNKRLLFVMEINEILYDLDMLKFLQVLHSRGQDSLSGSIGAVLIHSCSDLGTKRAAQGLVFLTNSLGCAFIGHPIVEATSSLRNFLTWQKTMNVPLKDICIELCKRLGKRLSEYEGRLIDRPKLTVLYSSPHRTSNTLDFWHMVSSNLPKGFCINEIQIDNGDVQDCKGCSYTLCTHYGKQNSCFYGGVMVSNVLPAIETSDAVIWLCPNYNDSIAANLTAAINRLTVLYNKMNFYDKNLFGVVVSGNSGSDSVAMQLIGALNINKGFRLPPYAVLTETANDPGAIYNIPDIEDKAYHFSMVIAKEIRSHS